MDRDGIARRTSELRKAKTPVPFSEETEDELLARMIVVPETFESVSVAGEVSVVPQSEIRFEGFKLPSVVCISSGRDRVRELRVVGTLPSSLETKRRIWIRGGAETASSLLRLESGREKLAAGSEMGFQ
jgi:hypothetical protein